MTERGFRDYARIVDSYGGLVGVRESSSAAGPHVWVYLEGTCHVTGEITQRLRDEQRGPGFMGAHLNPDQAWRLRDALDAFLASGSPSAPKSDRLAWIEGLLAGITPGEWTAGFVRRCKHPADEVCPGIDCTENAAIGVGIPAPLPTGRNLVIAECGDVGYPEHEAGSRRDAAFIAAAPAIVRELVDRVRQLEADAELLDTLERDVLNGEGGALLLHDGEAPIRRATPFRGLAFGPKIGRSLRQALGVLRERAGGRP